ncbi:hypothetical protein COOONC_04487 [Cooperia oncophora]
METTAAETTVAETTVEDTTVGVSVVGTTIFDITVAETVVEEITVTVTEAPETTVAETTAAETTVAETTVEETTVAETTVEETTVAETTIEETTVAETTIAETTVEETTASETTESSSTGESTTGTYVDEPVLPNGNYVDEPYVPKGKSKVRTYGGGEEKIDKISQGGYAGNIKVVPSGYRREEQTPEPASQGYGSDDGPNVEPAGYRKKRANEYGDENVTPPPYGGPPVPGGDSYAEQTPEPASQGYGSDDGPNVEPAGYRKKRANEYGDENVTPPPYGGPPVPGGDSYAEETPAPIDQGYGASESPPVVPGGYRKKRANEYGDENVTPPPYGGPPVPGGDSYAEETPAPVDQGYASESPPVAPGGYRKKRANQYGDELITPPPYSGPGGSEGSNSLPGDDSYGATRRGNEYGDESITPAPIPGGDDSYGAPPTPGYGDIGEETPVPVDQGYFGSEAPPVEPAGY